METKESRIVELKALGAGDATCQDCLGMGIHSMDVCRQCIKDAPAFTAVVKRFIATSKVADTNVTAMRETLFKGVAPPERAVIDWDEIAGETRQKDTGGDDV